MADVKVEKDIVMMSLEKIKPYDRNPRRNDKTVELLVKVIPKVGFNVPLVIDKANVIVKGHARFTAAIRLGMAEVPCIVSHADPDAIKADRLTDNLISELSEWINSELVSEVNSIDFDLSDIGLPKITFDDMPKADVVSEAAAPEIVSEKQKRFGETPYYKVVCDKCGYTMFIKEDEA